MSLWLNNAVYAVSTAYLRLAESLLPKSLGQPQSPLNPSQPFAVYSPFLLIALYLPSTLTAPSSSICGFAAASLSQAEHWTASSYHLPSAEEYLRSCWQVLYKASSGQQHRIELIDAALSGRSIEAKREALDQLADLANRTRTVVDSVQSILKRFVLDKSQAGDIRVAAAEILRFSTSTPDSDESFDALRSLYETTADVPLREALVPVLAGAANGETERDAVLTMIELWSRPNEVSHLLLIDMLWSIVKAAH